MIVCLCVCVYCTCRVHRVNGKHFSNGSAFDLQNHRSTKRNCVRMCVLLISCGDGAVTFYTSKNHIILGRIMLFEFVCAHCCCCCCQCPLCVRVHFTDFCIFQSQNIFCAAHVLVCECVYSIQWTRIQITWQMVFISLSTYFNAIYIFE